MKITMAKRGILFAMAILSLNLVAAPHGSREVIDLGSLKVDGAARGPEVRLIDSGRIDASTAERLVFTELSAVEKRLLGVPTAPKGKTP